MADAQLKAGRFASFLPDLILLEFGVWLVVSFKRELKILSLVVCDGTQDLHSGPGTE